MLPHLKNLWILKNVNKSDMSLIQSLGMNNPQPSSIKIIFILKNTPPSNLQTLTLLDSKSRDKMYK
jgi:hypothetical protein